jgi:hypothetical protein
LSAVITDPAAVDDPFEIDGLCLRALSQLLDLPSRYTQRFVEELSFLPDGGQQWRRTLQIRIPDRGKDERRWWIVPLGEFKRFRLADIVVVDADDRRLNLVTRDQHGDVLSGLMAAKFTRLLDEDRLDELRAGEPAADLAEVRRWLFDFLVSVVAPAENWIDDSPQPLHRLSVACEKLLSSLGPDRANSADQARAFVDELARGTQTAPYLCWVEAAPGDVVNLRATFTARDSNHKQPPGSPSELLSMLVKGLTDRSESGRNIRSHWLRQFGLMPIDYALAFPINVGAPPASYYLTIKPPAHTAAAFLDWGVDNSFNRKPEIDCAHPAAHIHHKSVLHGGLSGKVWAYLRCAPYRHKQMLGTTVLNAVVIALLAKGVLLDGLSEPLQGLIFASPSILLAFLAQQQRHYYSYAMRGQRALLWLYLGLSVAFLVSVTFSEVGAEERAGLLWWSVGLAWLLAIASAGVFAWQMLLGGTYDRITRYTTERRLHDGKGVPGYRCYASATRRFAFRILALVVVAMVAAGLVMGFFVDLGPGAVPVPDNGSTVSKSRAQLRAATATAHAPPRDPGSRGPVSPSYHRPKPGVALMPPRSWTPLS